MIFAIGTKSERKLPVIEKVLKEIIPDKKINLIAIDAKSNVSETPWDEETMIGAQNRAQFAKKTLKRAEYAIGIESGLVTRYGQIYEEAWCCIIDRNGKEYFGYSSGLKLPEYISQKMKEHNLPHYLIFSKIEEKFNKESHSDTWGFYSNYMISREVSIEESLRNVLVQIFSSKDSFYHK